MKDAFQQAASCVTDAVLVVSPGGYLPARVPHRLEFAQAVPVRLAGAGAIALALNHFYRVDSSGGDARRWRIVTTGYSYSFRDGADREILAYHWHPDVPDASYPHLHIGHGAVRGDLLSGAGLALTQNALRSDLAKAHLPTRPITFETVPWLALTQFGVRPRRADWRQILPAPSSG